MKEAAVRKEEKNQHHLGDAWSSEEDLALHQGEIDEGIGLFFGFASVAFILLSFSLFLAIYLISPRLSELHPRLPHLLTYAVAGLLSLVVLILVLTFLTVATGRRFLPGFFTLAGKDKGLIMMLTSPAVKLGGWIGVSRDRIASSFIKVNNALVVTSTRGGGQRGILLLLPRCIQHSKCKQKVEIEINNCKDCGLCDIAEIIRICEDHSVEAFVATGGNIARKLIMQKKPSAVIGVACERELLSGIHDTSGLPVIGIPNLRPEGPCIDTRVDLVKMEQAIKAFMT